jgi:hypothetical protein
LGSHWHGSLCEYKNVIHNSVGIDQKLTVCTKCSRGETAAQRPSIDALVSLLLAAPDHADRLVRECLPALHDILADVHRSSDVYASALSLLGEITNTAAYSLSIIGSGIIEIVVQWLR